VRVVPVVIYVASKAINFVASVASLILATLLLAGHTFVYRSTQLNPDAPFVTKISSNDPFVRGKMRSFENDTLTTAPGVIFYAPKVKTFVGSDVFFILN